MATAEKPKIKWLLKTLIGITIAGAVILGIKIMFPGGNEPSKGGESMAARLPKTVVWKVVKTVPADCERGTMVDLKPYPGYNRIAVADGESGEVEVVRYFRGKEVRTEILTSQDETIDLVGEYGRPAKEDYFDAVRVRTIGTSPIKVNIKHGTLKVS